MRVAAPIAAAVLMAATTASAGEVTTETHAGRAARVYVPAKVATPAALVVMLHGCTQTPDGFADATKMDEVADEGGFVVAYPEQPQSVGSGQCWRWWDPAHQARDAGEPKAIADVTDAIARGHGVDPEHVYVAGISAGGAMSVILGATYPDRFTAIGIVAGLEYKAAGAFSEVLAASSGGGPDPDAQGDLAHAQMGTRARALPVLVVHGSADGVVAKVNGDQVAAQWRRTNARVLGDGAIDAPVRETGEAGYTFTRIVHRNKANGASLIEQVVVEGLGHAWPGGKEGGSYSDAKGPDASRMLWSFFRGRKLSAPLDVAPPAPPASSDAGSATPAATPPNGEGNPDGGCAITAPHGTTTTGPTLAALALALGGLACARRRR